MKHLEKVTLKQCEIWQKKLINNLNKNGKWIKPVNNHGSFILTNMYTKEQTYFSIYPTHNNGWNGFRFEAFTKEMGDMYVTFNYDEFEENEKWLTELLFKCIARHKQIKENSNINIDSNANNSKSKQGYRRTDIEQYYSSNLWSYKAEENCFT